MKAKATRVAVNVFVAARRFVENQRIIAGRANMRVMVSRNDDFYTAEERKRDEQLDAEDRKEAETRAAAELEELTILAERSARESVIFRGRGALPSAIAEQIDRYVMNEYAFALFNDRLYCLEGPLTDDEFALLTYREFERERKFFSRIDERRRAVARSAVPVEPRLRIPQKVQREVWVRDAGKCVRCGSNLALEFDHIIPVAKGGSSTVRNVQLLCEACNQAKSDTI